MTHLSIPQARKKAAELIEAVLDERMSPQMALNRWPETACRDVSLAAANQALWHLEADEELQQREVFYLDAQLELLKQMGRVLAKGAPLPLHLQAAFRQEYYAPFYYRKSFKDSIRQDILQWLAGSLRLFQTAFGLVVRR